MGALVWLTDARAIDDAALTGFTDWLSPAEALRLGAFVRPLRQRQFLIGHVLLRQALGQLLGCPAAQVRLVERPGAAPQLEWPDSAGVGLSISHSGPWVACAVSATSLLGLDIEVVDPARDLAALAEQAFDGAEQGWWESRPAATRTKDFYDVWCAREARIKLHAEPGGCVHLSHDELAIALCSEQPLTARLELRSLTSQSVSRS